MYVAEVPGGSECLWLPFGDLVEAPAVRQVEIDTDRRGQRPADVGEVLREEHDDQLCAVVETRIEVPPLVGSGAPVRACPVFPCQHLIPLNPDPLIVLGCRPEACEKAAHRAPPFCPRSLSLVAVHVARSEYVTTPVSHEPNIRDIRREGWLALSISVRTSSGCCQPSWSRLT